MKICIFASVGCQNLGDELIVKNEILEIEKNPEKYGIKKAKKYEFQVFSYDVNDVFFVKDNVFYSSYFPIGVRNPKNIFRNMRAYLRFLSVLLRSRYVIVGGGGLFYDSEKQISQKNLDLWVWRKKYFTFFTKKLIFFGVSIDIKKEESVKKIKTIFSGAYKIFVRDEYSKKLLSSFSFKSELIRDPVFLDNGLFLEDRSLLLAHFDAKKFHPASISKIDFTGKIVGFSLRSGYLSPFPALEKLMIEEFLQTLLSKGAREVILLPHSFHKTDMGANDLVFLQNFLSEKIVMGGETLGEVYECYTKKEMDVCIAMRLHSIILCQVYKIPFISLSYAKKTEEIVGQLQGK